MVGTFAGGGSLPVLTNRRRLDIEGNCRARSTLLGGGEQSLFAPIGGRSRRCRRRALRHDSVEDRDVTVIMDGSPAQAPRLF
jgi:hypothetical protein